MSQEGLALLVELRRAGVRLQVDGDALRFQAPKGALTPELRARLRAHRDEILAFLRAAPGAEAREAARVGDERVSIAGSSDPVPLSFAQQRLWFMHQLAPESAFYNMPLAIRLRGPLDVIQLERALNGVLRRHDVLRTTFPSSDGHPVQRVHAHEARPLPLVDLSSHDLPEDRALAFAEREAREPFDLEEGPLVRFLLLRLSTEHHMLVLTMHHIVSDGWSMSILVRELKAGMGGLLLPDLPLQYAEFARWQRGYLRQDRLDKLLSYWTEKLADVPALRLPTDRSAPELGRYQGRQHRFQVDAATVRALRAMAKETQSTLFMILLTGLSVVLMRWSGQADLCVGTAVANRNRREIEPLIGFFVNTLALRTDLSGDPSLEQAVGRVRQTALDAYAHQDLPFEVLVEALGVERQPGRNPLFQIMVVLQNTPRESIALGNLEVETVALELMTSKFDLTLEATETGDNLSCLYEYDEALFDEATIQLLERQLILVLRALGNQPRQRLSRVSLADARDLAELRVHALGAPLPDTRHPVSEAVASHRRLAPDRLAVCTDESQLTYESLESQAESVARWLLATGPGEQRRVAVACRNQALQVVGVLAALKAGAAFVPLDPEHPAGRWKFILEDSGASDLLTDFDADWPDLRRLRLDGAVPEIDVALPRETPPASLCYIVYTSGTTGTPRGVAVEHRNLESSLLARAQQYPEAPSALLMWLSPAFDAGVGAMLWALYEGATLVVVPVTSWLDPAAVRASIALHRVSHLVTTPSLYRLLLDTGTTQDLASLRQVVIGGEACPAELARMHTDSLPHASLASEYGPTEATIWATVQEVAASRAPGLGHPIAGTRCYVLDDHLRPSAPGELGELYLAGAGVARGYWRRPSITAQRFLPDPFDAAAGERMVRTGDLVRRTATGDLRFVGRRDFQVKLRGLRVEIEEVEAVLGAHPAVAEAAVVVTDDDGTPQLTAFVHVRPQEAGGVAEVCSEHVSAWRTLYDHSHEAEGCLDPRFDIRGWNSSFTGRPYGADEMRAWRDHTVSLLRGLGLGTVLEIGCGTGLLLFALLSDCDRVDALDFSQPVLNRIDRVLTPHEKAKVRTFCRNAEAVDDLPASAYDLVIINSVVQYLPDVGQLLRVLDGALERVRPGGHLFVGDVRNLALLEAFHAAVQLEQAKDDASCAELAERAHRQAALESELLIDPPFFRAWASTRKVPVEVRLFARTTHAPTEMNLYRYDVVVHRLDREAPSSPQREISVRWGEDARSLEDLANLVRAAAKDPGPMCFVLGGLPDRRVARDVRAAASFRAQDATDRFPPLTARAFRERLAAEDAEGAYAVDLRDVVGLGESLDCSVTIGPADAAGRCEAVLLARGARPPSPVPHEGLSTVDAESYANDPLRVRRESFVQRDLAEHLSRVLPGPMVPSRFVLLNALPRTTNGKVDRPALAALGRARPVRTQTLPQDDVEKALVAIFCEVLDRPVVSVDDNFFELGGDSIRAVQVTARARNHGLALRTQDIFLHPTIAELAPVAGNLPPPSVHDHEASTTAIAAWGDGRETSQAQRWAESRFGGSVRAAPLLPVQQGLLFHTLGSGDPSMYLTQIRIGLAGEVRGPLLEQAWNHVVRAHPALRASFHTEGPPEPVQVVHEAPRVRLKMLDFSHAPDAQHLIREHVLNDRKTPIDLTDAPAMRVCLLRADDRHVHLLWTTHHILLDGWSAARVVADVAACYAALTRGETPALRTIDGPSLARRALAEIDASEHRAFWSSVLSDAPTTGSLAILEAPRCQTPRGHQRVVARLPAAEAAALTSYARAHGLTLSTLVHAAWGMLLCAANDARDVVFGTTVSVRPEQESEAEHAVGLFINTVPFRVRLDPQARMHEWLGRLQESHAAVRMHGIPSLVDIRRWAGLAHRALFHSVLIYESAPRFATSFADGLVVEDVEDFATSHYPLTVVVLPPDGHRAMELRAGFDPTRVSHDLALRLLDGMALLLARIARSHGHAVDDVLREVTGSAVFGEAPVDVHARWRRALEQAIASHPWVEDCVVLSRSGAHGQPSLVAYIVGRGAGSAAGLREYLAREHPEIPQPEAFLFLQAMPLDGNGGVDETALQALPVQDERTLQDVRALLAEFGADRCAPCLGRVRRSLPRQHLSRLLPGWRRFPREDGGRDPVLPHEAGLLCEDRGLAPRAITPWSPLVFPAGSPSTLPEALIRAARERPGHGVTFLEDAGVDEQRVLYSELLGEARRVASGLRVAGVCPGSFVLVQCLLNRDMLLAFWGCTLAGAVPVLLGVPASFSRPGADLKRVEAACALLGPAVLADEATFDAIRSSTLLRLPHTQVLTLDPLRRMAPTCRDTVHDPDAPALVLLTSGSTGRPKAVIQTHRTLLSRCEGANQMNAVGPEDVAFNWMPIHHVGGIVSIHLQDVLAMASEVHAPTRDILADPLRWLDALARCGATMTWAPNFAFGLVNARLQEAPERRWNLASVRLVVNAGETIVPSTAQRFMSALASSGLSPRAMVPGWGMSETCSGTNYCHDFHTWDPKDQGGFLDLGPTIAGFQMRVVDGAGRVVAEGQPGSLEVRGAPVTPGYHDVGELNARAFSPDGWLRTGDIAILRNGRLTLTGRRSDQIVVDGVNYHAHEIESAVEELPDVRASFTAACAVPDAHTGGDRLAIFFCPSSDDAQSAPDSLACLVRSIRRQVVQRVGLNPALVVPVTASELPRTDIGKIKRRELATRLIEGRFDDVLDALDLATGSENTLPDWFFQRTWRERRLPEPSEGTFPSGRTLVFADELGLATALEPLSSHHGDDWVVVHAGSGYHRHGPSRFTIDPADAGHYDRLARDLDVHEAPVRRVLHLWGYDDPTSVSTDPEDLHRHLDQTVVSGMLLVQMLLRNQGEPPFSLLFATTGGQVVGDGDAAEPASSAVAGLVRTLPLEEPSVRTRWVDFEGLDPSKDARSLAAELRVGGGCPETAYRAGVRWVPRIRPATLLEAKAPRPEPLVAHHGLVLITGGLGGMGVWLARFLSDRYQARLLLIGRTPTPGPALAALDASCPFVTYASVDVCDLAGLQTAVQRAEQLFSARLVAVFHLAGHGDVSSHWESGDAHRLRHETAESLREMLRPKALGALAVRQLLRDHPTASYVAFSSVHGWFGGATLGSYAAANGYLDTDALAYAAREGRRVLSVAWSSWRGTGMSAQAPAAAVDAARALGFCALEPQQGLRSLEVALEQGWSHVLVGLDGTRAHVARHVDGPPLQEQEVLLCHTGAAPAITTCTDRFGVPVPVRPVSVSEIPMTPSGEVDQDRLASLAVLDPGAFVPSLALSPLQQSLADVFRKVLGLGRAVGAQDNFFDLGADSLSLVKAHAMIVHDLGVTLSLVDLFHHTTIEKLAAHLEQNATPARPSPATDPAEAGKELAAGRRERRRVRRERGRGGRE